MNYDDFLLLGKAIDIDKEIIDKVYKYLSTLNVDEINAIYSRVNNDNVDFEEVRESLNDDDGIKLLAISLFKVIEAHEIYKEKNISDEIYISTFKCFSRFINETKVYSKMIFDRYFWTWRQISLRIFRIGELEYEILNDEKEISIHIPSDAGLSTDKIDESIKLAKEFMAKYFKETISYKYSVCSWMINDSLYELLPKDSKIIKFKERFEVCKVFPEETSYIIFIFRTKNNDINTFDNSTTLQKNLISYLKSGNKFGCSYGVLKERK